MEPIICIYHKDCVDGTTAAAVVLKKFSHAQTFPLGHGYESEEIEAIFDSTDPRAHVYIVDSTLGLQECVARGHTVTVLDHHISEFDRVTAFVKDHAHVTYHFDNTKSGASLTWLYFFPELELPQLIKHVEDKDIWLEKYGIETEHVTHFLSMYRNDPVAVADFIDEPIDTIYARGSLITAYVHSEEGKLILLEPNMLRIGTHMVPAYNIGTHQSACGNTLSGEHGSVVGLYTISGEMVRISFRSKDSQTPSALELATHLGGGGHRNAAGARMSLGDFISSLRAE